MQGHLQIISTGESGCPRGQCAILSMRQTSLKPLLQIIEKGVAMVHSYEDVLDKGTLSALTSFRVGL